MPSAVEQILAADTIDGHRFVRLETVEKAKEILNRKKDKKDIDYVTSLLNDVEVD